MSEEEAYNIYRRLGGVKTGEQAHPLAMTLLTAVAAAHNASPLDALERHPDELVKDLNDKLFYDLYRKVLTLPLQHALRVCEMYRDEIPDAAAIQAPGESAEAALRRAAQEVAGKVWSINVYARKPGA